MSRILRKAFAAAALILTACAQSPQAAPTPVHDAHSSTDTGAPFDARFIDAMIAHHQGAIDMAKDAQQQAQRPEITALANAVLNAQAAEIAQMKAWRTSWYAELKDTGGMNMDMGPMAVPAGDASYDVRFIDAMIPHHESAIAMAQDALEKAGHAEIKTLAQAIIAAQTAEIAQMKQWREAWTKGAFYHFPHRASAG